MLSRQETTAQEVRKSVSALQPEEAGLDFDWFRLKEIERLEQRRAVWERVLSLVPVGFWLVVIIGATALWAIPPPGPTIRWFTLTLIFLLSVATVAARAVERLKSRIDILRREHTQLMARLGIPKPEKEDEP
jgi:hypothetical protein